MALPAIGDSLPNIEVHATNGETFKLSQLKGQNLVLYFYPRDNTPGCTTESCDFRDLHAEFKKHNTLILGVSRDSLQSHDKFKTKFEFPFDLIADTEEQLCDYYDVVKDKNMYGKKVRGIERSTFVYDSKGKLRHEWRKVKVPGHVDEVLAAIKSL